ncbi:YceI family protein [Limisphaera ngatamarikiensis]|uniref:YceI family protein n=1 Tax=Limisphaera ngatamarikiensis TaxID=1324935 RepID=A0A6M1RHU3_9BACT|nr:YceI family protein [Limisphaera ngatamarikiensis]NGO39206.1 YceI family protein [Limisphaera ngatamarikiensis]
MKTSALVWVLGLWLGASAAVWAGPQEFDFQDPKGVNNVVFHLDAPLESISGSATGISGKVTFDPENPAATRGRLVVTAESLHVPNPLMKQHLHGPQWMDVKRFPEIVFEAVGLEDVTREGSEVTARVRGRLTIRDVTREMVVPVRLTYLKGKLADRTNGQMQGDLLVIRSRFVIRRSDFGINPGAPQDKVADEIELTLSLAGAAPRS